MVVQQNESIAHHWQEFSEPGMSQKDKLPFFNSSVKMRLLSPEETEDLSPVIFSFYFFRF